MIEAAPVLGVVVVLDHQRADTTPPSDGNVILSYRKPEPLAVGG